MYGKIWGLGIAALLCLMVFAASAQAFEPIKLDVTPSTLTTYGNSSATFRISLKNQEDFNDDFIISITGRPGWATLEKYYMRLLPQESTDVKLLLTPLDVAGAYSYDITVLSLINPSIKMTKTVYLNVLPTAQMPIIMDSFDMKKTGNRLEFNIGINSSIEREIGLGFTVRDSSGDLVAEDSLTENVRGLEILNKVIDLPGGLIAGNYNVLVSVRDTNLTQRASFYIEAIKSIKKTKTIVSNPFFEEVKITVNNQGNMAEEYYKIKETFPNSLIVNFLSPARCLVLETEKECEWVIERLEIGEEASIIYRIEYWPLMVIWGIIVVVIIIIVIGTAKKAVKPTIRKTLIRKGKGIYTIVLEVKNPFYYTLNNVMVRDWVTPLVKIKKEFRGPKPVIRASEAGAELIWRFGEIKPRDEVIMHYEVNAVVHGQLKMPRAFVKYTTHKGVKDKVYSKPLIVE